MSPIISQSIASIWHSFPSIPILASAFDSEPTNRLAIGIGMVPRGEVGLVFAGIGAASGVLSKPLEAAIIIMVILTTFLAPPLLRVAFKEQDKVEQTDLAS